jgi:hypothetical protein
VLDSALIEQRPIALKRMPPQIFQRDEHRGERQQREPYELPLPADVEAEGDGTTPNHIRKIPGDITSSANKIAARIIQVQGPNAIPLIVAAP